MLTKKQIAKRNTQWLHTAAAVLAMPDHKGLSNVEWVAINVGCSLAQAAWIVERLHNVNVLQGAE